MSHTYKLPIKNRKIETHIHIYTQSLCEIIFYIYWICDLKWHPIEKPIELESKEKNTCRDDEKKQHEKHTSQNKTSKGKGEIANKRNMWKSLRNETRKSILIRQVCLHWHIELSNDGVWSQFKAFSFLFLSNHLLKMRCVITN